MTMNLRAFFLRIETKGFKCERKFDRELGGEAIQIQELTNGGSFGAKFSMEGGKWLSKLLCQLSMGLTKTGSSFRCLEPFRSIIGTLRVNKGGMFVQITVHNKRTMKKFSTICIPKGDIVDNFGCQINKLLAKEMSFPQALARNTPPQMGFEPFQQLNDSFETAKQGRESERHHPEIVNVEARGRITAYSWWLRW
ncbi:hypothetical protein FRX31_025641 [Thalictrum thalictroides]|uniref:Uncharacterized protein n=1 Tax=Thalictrum thalictroides TaxID=46969 RepID=A0A7J6VIL7_THATH|nr:hypothetical protein FRX31_025641 [Thalictrum thalictroides]